ncbi:MAG: hypothetical protein U0795_14940 [Pirellulales bacterium]
MAAENPYTPPTMPTAATVSSHAPSARVLWRAYFWAPAVAPLAFVVLLFVVALVAQSMGASINELSLIVLPTFALTLGLVVSYVLAGLIGMPIAFWLRYHNRLNRLSIHLAALFLALILGTGCAIATIGDSWDGLLVWVCYVVAGFVPSALISATAFWWLVQKYSRLEAEKINSNLQVPPVTDGE